MELQLIKRSKVLVLKRISLLVFTALILFACQNKQVKQEVVTEEKTTENTSFKMYTLSPMAQLMEEMHANALAIKAKLEAGETEFGEFPESHLKLMEAKMTDPTDRDMFFETQAKEFLAYEKAFYESKKSDKIEEYNAIINSCLTCHQQKCGGPIPRIKKLKIQ